MKLLKPIALMLSYLVTINGYAIERVSLDVNGGDPNGESGEGSVSAGGRYVVFQSTANDINGNAGTSTDIFVFDRQNQTSEVISVSTSGVAGNGNSILPDISDDGNLVVFASAATNLTADNDGNGALDIFLRNRSAGTTILISQAGGVSTAGISANNISTQPVISADGRYIAYQSLANNINAGDAAPFNTQNPNLDNDVYRYDIATGTTTLVSVNNSGVKGNSRSEEPSISGTGRFVTFSSGSNNLGGPTNDQVLDVFFRDMAAGITTAVTKGSTDASGFTDSQQGLISDDGTIVVFESYQRTLSANDTNGEQDVFVYDVTTGTYTQMSVSSTGEPGNARAGHPGISADGRYVIFESSASNLDTNVTNGQINVYVRDRALGLTKRISIDENGNEGSGLSQKPRISSTGRYIVFSSQSRLVTSDTTTMKDAYFVDINIDDGGVPIDPDDPINPPPFKQVSRVFSDLDGDKKSDILWRHAVTGDNWHYLMNGNVIRANGLINQVADLGWKMVGVGDFNADGKSDIFWRNDRTGLNFVYLMDGGTITTLAPVNTAGLSWKVKGVGDFDGDGKSDILWRNDISGLNWIYLMDGTNIKSSGALNVASSDWKIVGVGDFNGDTRSDILWRNSSTGQNWMYLMNGIGIQSHGAVNTVPNQNWKVEGVGDLNGDSRSDIVWRNTDTGENYMYQMEGLTIGGIFHINTVPDINWEIKGVGDYNGDAKTGDILWRHAITGDDYVYYMNGSSISSLLFINRVADTNWQMQGIGD